MPGSFVGRAAEVTGLAALWGRADDPAGPTVALVFGRPGEGKTRLLAEIRTRVAAADLVALHGYEPESGVSLASARDLLAALSSGPEGSLLHRLLTGSAAQTETLQLFEAAFQALRSRRVLRLVVDDLQWVDPTSAALLHYLVRAADGVGCALTLLAAGRPTVASTRLAAALGSALSDSDRMLRIELGPLDRDAGTRLARELAPDLDERGAAQLWQEADGSPFWIEELARSRGNDPTGGELGFRLRGLSGDAAGVLAVLAAAGRHVERAHLVELGGWPAAGIDRAVDDLGALGLVTEAGSAVAVAHDLIRASIADRLPRETLRQGHERLARWLAGQAGDAALLEAIGHGRRAGVPVLRPALRLAGSPRRRLLGPDGLRVLRSVVADSDVGTPEGAALDRATAQLATELGEHETALAAWSAIARRTRDASLRAAATLAAAQSAMQLGRTAEAERLIDQAGGASSAGTGVEVDARAAAVQLCLLRRPSEGTDAALRAVRAARRLADSAGDARNLSGPDRQAYLHALLAGAEAAIFADRPADVLALTDELAAAATSEDGRVRLRALAEGSLALRWTGRNEDAEARLRMAWTEARAEALPRATVEIGALLALVLHSRGRLAEAAQVITESEELGRRLAEYCPSRAITLIIRHLLQASGGDWSGAANGLRLAAEGEETAHYRLQAHMERALLLARYDPRRSAAEVHAGTRAALADATESGCRRCTLEVRARSAEALARVGDPGGARELLDAFDPDPVSGSRALHWWGSQARAALLTAEGKTPGSVVTAWEEAVAEADRCGFVLEALWARIDLAGVLAGAGADRARAATLFRQVGVAAEAIGARTEAQAVDRALRALGVRTWGRAGGTGLVLTAREGEIAARVAAGASNAEIAAAMFLSRKTVERHVSNVLGKSGLRNRAEIAAAWATKADSAPRPEGVHR